MTSFNTPPRDIHEALRDMSTLTSAIAADLERYLGVEKHNPAFESTTRAVLEVHLLVTWVRQRLVPETV